MNTKVNWIDRKRVHVETQEGKDFILGFSDDTNFLIEQQSIFQISRDLGLLFDYYYKGDNSVIMGKINQQLIQHGYSSVLFFETFEPTKKDDERVRIGLRIKEIRQEKGLDAKTLAYIAGIDSANLCRIEAGKYSVGFDILSKIANVCGKKVDFIDLGKDGNECSIKVRS